MKITTEIIKALNPCADRLERFMAPYPIIEGTHQDFLSLEKISHSDKLWVLLRLMPRLEVEVFAIDCAVGVADAADAAYYAANAAAYDAEGERQLDAINYLINKSEELNEKDN